jgi:hypothetical protein
MKKTAVLLALLFSFREAKAQVDLGSDTVSAAESKMHRYNLGEGCNIILSPDSSIVLLGFKQYGQGYVSDSVLLAPKADGSLELSGALAASRVSPAQTVSPWSQFCRQRVLLGSVPGEVLALLHRPIRQLGVIRIEVNVRCERRILEFAGREMFAAHATGCLRRLLQPWLETLQPLPPPR